MRGLLLISALFNGLHAQTPEALQRIRARMAGSLERQPNYTCLETVERAHQDRRGESEQDTIRLEVALVDGKEMFAWPGSQEFEDRGIQDLVPSGMFANGNFAMFARIVFISDFANFEFRGETKIDGRRMVRYDFRVPNTRSGYRLRVGSLEAVVGFHGSFYADRETEDVRRLEISADGIPPQLGVLSADDRMDYGRLRIGEGDFLLPTRSELRMEMSNEEDHNSATFSGCRRFAGQSVLSFEDPSVEESKAVVKATEINLPANSPLQMEFRDDLDLTRAAVGDPVQALLREPVVQVDATRQKHSLAPKGAVARGRIIKLERHSTFFLLGIEFRDLEWPGARASLKAKFESAAAVLPSNASRGRPPLAPAAEGSDIVVFRPGLTRLKGIVMYWRTQQ